MTLTPKTKRIGASGLRACAYVVSCVQADGDELTQESDQHIIDTLEDVATWLEGKRGAVRPTALDFTLAAEYLEPRGQELLRQAPDPYSDIEPPKMLGEHTLRAAAWLREQGRP